MNVSYKLNKDRTVAITGDVVLLPIDDKTPRGVTIWLGNKPDGVVYKGQFISQEKTPATHWFPCPVFPKDA